MTPNAIARITKNQERNRTKVLVKKRFIDHFEVVSVEQEDRYCLDLQQVLERVLLQLWYLILTGSDTTCRDHGNNQ